MLTFTTKGAVEGAVSETLTLTFDRRQRSRQRVRLDSGAEAGVMLPPGTTLADGDRLCDADGTAVRVRAAVEAVSTARTGDPVRFARACYHLGNRHVRIQVGDGWVRYKPDHVLDDMVRQLGLTVTAETTPFEPERGAYGGHGHHHHHHADDADDHGHTHGPHGHHH